jgi:hypothetical protein
MNRHGKGFSKVIDVNIYNTMFSPVHILILRSRTNK